MKTTYGQFNPDGGEGYLRPVYFPSLATMDSRTGDGRLLKAEGGGVYGNTLPRSIMAQFETMPGHFEAKAVGSLQEVTLHEGGNISGMGWLADVPEAHHLATLNKTKSLFHNSVDLADIEYTAEWESDDPDDPGFWNLLIDFTKWGIAATTFVNVPAFANAHGTLDAPSEITASMAPEDTIVFEFASTVITFREPEELTASLATDTKFDDFHKPEPSHPTKHTVTPDGCVFGHVADWTKPHSSMTGTRYVPRPANYDSFHEGSVETDRGTVRTGPLFFLGGHPDNKLGHPRNAEHAYGGVENGWADVRVVNGRFGPWYCGRIRPGMSEEAIYVARASGISGHWVGDELAAIVSVNVRGYSIPGSKLSADHDGAIVKDGRVVELVASLHLPERPSAQEAADKLATLPGFTSMTPMFGGGNIQYTTGADVTVKTETDDEIIEAWDAELYAIEQEAELQLELDD